MISHKDEIAIRVSNISKSFKLPHEKNTSVKSLIVNPFKKRFFEKQQVLSDISFEVKKGEFLGIVGRNGSGKSTLLKLMSGIYSPNKGEICVNGSLIPFIELGVGFNFDLTGRENVFLNGALLGFNRKEMLAMYDDIVDFAELQNFMDQKLKNYSSGMQVRLAFSIAIRAKGDILLLDEVLAVGDANFQKKCNDYFEEIKESGRTVILVTHSMDVVKRYCSRAILIDKGRIKTAGHPIEVANQYSIDNMNAATEDASMVKIELHKEVKKLDVKLLTSPLLKSTESLKFEIIYELTQDLEVDLGFSIVYQSSSIIEHNTKELTLGSKKDVTYSVEYELPLNNFRPAEMDIYVSIFKRENFKSIGFKSRAVSFAVENEGSAQGGLIRERGKWLTKTRGDNVGRSK